MPKLNKKNILRLREEAHSMQYIGNMYGCTRQYVHSFMKRNDIKDFKVNYERPTFKKIVDNLDTIKQLYSEGKDLKWIAKYLKINKSLLIYYKRKYSVIAETLPRRPKLSKEHRQAYMKAYMEKYKQTRKLKKSFSNI